MYSKRLPSSHEIVGLSTRITAYPVTRTDAVRTARMWNFSNDVVEFLRQFPADELFDSRSSLVVRCDNTAARIRHQWETARGGAAVT